ncbi:MAG: methyl-accepting chemotaxis protein, partial [Mariprofundus sp.]|nr:methyl-accepting chemotaxis protein [Mariprofundus sp.]
ATEQLRGLDATRKSVDALMLMPKKVEARYSALNESLFDVFGGMVRSNYANEAFDLNPELALSADLALMQNSILTFMSLEEYLDQERSLLMNVFEKDAINRAELLLLAELAAKQHVYDTMFMQTGQSHYRKMMSMAMDSPQVRQVAQMRKTVQRKWKRGGFGITASDWFAAMSGKIELLRATELRLLEDSHAEIVAIETSSIQKLTILAIACVLTIALSIMLAWLIITSLTTSFRQAVGMAEDIAAGDLSGGSSGGSNGGGFGNRLNDNSDPGYGSDEAGQLMRALQSMRYNLTGLLNDELEPVLQAAQHGDLSGRLNTDGKQGFYLNLAQATNALNDQMETIVNDTVAGLQALEQGDLNYRISRSYEGKFDDIKQASNQTAEKLSEMLNKELQPVWQGIQRGDLSGRIAESGRQGFYLQLGKSSNELSLTIASAIEDITKGLAAIESGDLTYRIENDYEGEFDAIKQAIHQTSEKLAETITHVSNAVAEVDTAAGEMFEGNNLLSARTQEQAAALEETAASLEEITGTVQHTADNSRQANQLATGAKEQAEQGGAITKQAILAMSEIESSSRKVFDIIAVIDEIAFQTNLLALNAAVEAARAGEQGRGFAVVAGEVRTLAQRSAGAAKEIKGLIASSLKTVESGAKLVNESGQSLHEIIAAVAKVSDLIAEIDAGSAEQTAGIDQINQAIAQLDSNTQQNTAMVEESAAVSQRLNDQAGDLRQQVALFQIGDEPEVVPEAAAMEIHTKIPKQIKKRAKQQVREIVKANSDLLIEADDVWREF